MTHSLKTIFSEFGGIPCHPPGPPPISSYTDVSKSFKVYFRKMLYGRVSSCNCLYQYTVIPLKKKKKNGIDQTLA